MIAAGPLDRTIDLLVLQATGQDAMNVDVTELVPLASNVWAGILQMTSAERAVAATKVAEKTRVFLIRWRPGVKPGSDRVLRYENELYDIQSVDDYPAGSRQDGLRIVATARAE